MQRRYWRFGSSTRAIVASAVVVCCAPLAAAAQTATSAGSARSGEELYQAACIQCHGPTGKGTPADRLLLPVEPAQFADCNFATREADADWAAIVSHGGPARGFNRFMPAFGEALTRDEIARILGHVRTFCADRAWPRGELNLPRPLVTEKAFPEDEAVWTAAIASEGSGQMTNKFVYEKRLGARGQVELVVPLPAHARKGGTWQGGLGDVAVGFKRALVHSLNRGSILSVTGEVIFPTGDKARGYGKGVAIVEPFVTFGKLLPANTFVQAQGGVELPVDTTKAAREAFWRAVIGKTWSQGGDGRAWSPMIEMLGAKELVKGEKLQWDLVPQMQVTLSTRQHVRLNVGLQVPITQRGPRPTRLLMYVLWDWFDGGLFEGW